ncbi:MAG: 6-phosphogluconolactonase [Candidatus Eisenbacteria bacterium]|uniref:6-phosphogluconolactonase n=1 Tax=Eiseniibacteriota bacterium TaxID=2212470 RepID=A0A9D6L652_UNCEI|nr:6-phosphogluconolactonase [Candidatus Eisenbacteria bacterium]
MTTELLPETAARHIAKAIEQAVADHGRASVMLAGGSTPRAVHRQLVLNRRLPWDKVEIFFGDERAVPPADPQSNYRMARESLLDAAPIPLHQVHRMLAERPDHEAAADEYARRLPERLDLIILGLGEDGHTASLFPGSSALRETARKVVAVVGPQAPLHRLTVTPPVIAAAREKIILVSGSGKAGAVARALEGPQNPDACPAQLARDGIWIMDRAAASGLRHPPPR